MNNLIRSKLAPGEVEMLRASLLSGDDAREAFAAWRPHLDWDNITRSWQRLIPLLQHNLTAQGIHDPLIDRFRGLRRYFWLRNLKQMQLAFATIDALRAEKIAVLALKGLSIVACYFSDRSLRPMEDVDLLVRPDQALLATQVMGRLDIGPLNLRPRGIAELAAGGEFAGWPFVNMQGDYLDLHWCALHLDRRRSIDKDLWASARSVGIDGRTIEVMDPADQFIHACAHAVQDDGHSALRAVVDCATILRGGIDRQRLYRRADFHRLGPAISDMLDVLASDIGIESADCFSDRKPRRLQRLDMALLAGSRDPTASGPKQFMARAAKLRRGSDALFGRPLLASAWRLAAAERKGLAAPALTTTFKALGRPPRLRRWLASSASLRLPPLETLPTIAERRDVISEGLSASLLAGWSTDEPQGRWTIGREAIMVWRVAAKPGGNVFLSLRREPVAFGPLPVHSNIYANDLWLGAFEMYPGQDFPDRIRIPAEALAGQSVLALTIEIRNPSRPIDVGLSDDARPLGLLLSTALVFVESTNPMS